VSGLSRAQYIRDGGATLAESLSAEWAKASTKACLIGATRAAREENPAQRVLRNDRFATSPDGVGIIGPGYSGAAWLSIRGGGGNSALAIPAFTAD
jgi:hypothetical protein